MVRGVEAGESGALGPSGAAEGHDYPLKREGGIPAGWLAHLETTAVARAVEELERRLRADYRLVLELRRQDFTGPVWDQLARVLAEYGYAVIKPWIRTGEIFARCREKRFGGGDMYETTAVTNPADIDDLAQESVAFAVVKFREMLRAGRWHAEGGATLKTYFIGKVLSEFVEPYRRWRRQGRRWEDVDDEQIVDTIVSSGLSPLEQVIVGTEAQALLARVSDRVDQAILVHTAHGLTQEEIAFEVGLTSAKAVESRLYRLRKRIGAA